MTLTRKQNHFKRLLIEYVAISNADSLEKLSEITLDVIDESLDFRATKVKILSKLMEEANTYYSQELKDLLANKDNLNPLIQQLLDKSDCIFWF